MSDFLKGIGAVTLMLSTAAVVFLAICGLIEWYFTSNQTLFNTSFVSAFFPFWRVGIPCRKFS